MAFVVSFYFVCKFVSLSMSFLVLGISFSWHFCSLAVLNWCLLSVSKISCCLTRFEFHFLSVFTVPVVFRACSKQTWWAFTNKRLCCVMQCWNLFEVHWTCDHLSTWNKATTEQFFFFGTFAWTLRWQWSVAHQSIFCARGVCFFFPWGEFLFSVKFVSILAHIYETRIYPDFARSFVDKEGLPHTVHFCVQIVFFFFFFGDVLLIMEGPGCYCDVLSN